MELQSEARAGIVSGAARRMLLLSARSVLRRLQIRIYRQRREGIVLREHLALPQPLARTTPDQGPARWRRAARAGEHPPRLRILDMGGHLFSIAGTIASSRPWRTVIVPAVTESKTSFTPGTRRTVVSIFAAQEAHSIPPTR